MSPACAGELDAQTRDAVAPRFDAITEASSRVAALKATIDAITQLRVSWARVRTIESDIRAIKAERTRVNKAIKEKSEQLKASQTLVGDLSTEFGQLLAGTCPGSTPLSSTATPIYP